MLALGKFHTLKVIGQTKMHYMLDDGADGVLLDKKFAPHQTQIGHSIQVFVYLDANRERTITTLKPKGQVGDYVALKVREVNQDGAFLDWGLKKDLFLPLPQQLFDTEVGDTVVVKIVHDLLSDRIAATELIDDDFSNETLTVKELEVVKAMVLRKTDLGYLCIINTKHLGLLHYNEVFKKLEIGEQFTAFVKKIKEENKLDLMLGKPGYKRTETESDKIMNALEKANGFLPYHDKTDAETIYQVFGMSKKTFKMTIGMLYKNKLIRIAPDGIHRV